MMFRDSLYCFYAVFSRFLSVIFFPEFYNKRPEEGLHRSGFFKADPADPPGSRSDPDLMDHGSQKEGC